MEILNPENAYYRCDTSCGYCCERPVPVRPAEVMELSLLTGIPVSRMAVREKTEPSHFILRHTNYEEPCVFLQDSKCSLYNSEARPYICRLYPISLVIDLSAKPVSVHLDNPEKFSCVGKGQTEKMMPESELCKIVEKGIKLRAVSKAMPGDRKVKRFCKSSFELFQILSLDEAVKTLLGEGTTIMLM